jgi:hypothetical protein
MAYLKRHGKSGPRDLLIVASARVGQLQWQAACENRFGREQSVVDAAQPQTYNEHDR